MKQLLLIPFVFLNQMSINNSVYPWKTNHSTKDTIVNRIAVPKGYTRTVANKGSFAEWLRHLPLKSSGTPVKLWNGELKGNQTCHEAVVDIDFIGKNLQQCIDAIIRLRSEYLWSVNKKDDIKFSYTCCQEKIPWSKWKNGWRTKIVKRNGLYAFDWVSSGKVDASYASFKKYLFNIMMYAGTTSLSRDMEKVDASNVQIGDVYVQGEAPGYGHGVLIVDMAESAAGEKIMLLGQSYNPAENFNVLKSNSDISPWFRVSFEDNLYTPQWIFEKQHARRF